MAGCGGGRAVRMPSFETCLPHWFLHDLEWVPDSPCGLWHSPFTKCGIIWVIPFGHQFLGKQRCSLPHCIFLPIMSFTICSPIVHLNYQQSYLIWGQFIYKHIPKQICRNKYQISSFLENKNTNWRLAGMGHAEEWRSLRSTETFKSHGRPELWLQTTFITTRPWTARLGWSWIPGSDSDLDPLKNHHFYVDGLIVCCRKWNESVRKAISCVNTYKWNLEKHFSFSGQE